MTSCLNRLKHLSDDPIGLVATAARLTGVASQKGSLLVATGDQPVPIVGSASVEGIKLVTLSRALERQAESS
jgi:hypothetical protein